MALSDELLTTAFFGEGLSMQERIDFISGLAGKIATQKICSPETLLDATVATGVEPIEALVMNYRPQDYAAAAWENAQSLSAQVLSLNGKFTRGEGLGASTETAVHNLAWYGIARHGVGRYARLTTQKEDTSSSFGKYTGYDLIYRTDRRRWKIQVKSSGQPDTIINKYVKNIIVMTPEMLTGDRNATAKDLHEAVAKDDEVTLDYMWRSYLHQLRTQKASSGIRRVI
ncbi:MAG TPA: hypothetical protein PJ984_04185 [Candidatus Saccharibacteria bacterium]|jgi:hypothetical protein|nr:hypothetical protein [Patescibacteria group bacterium]HMS31565.1 hypothetical protein [Candidatus Saccharibacteria bacterium]